MLITLLTDFGTSDYFVAAMKGRILSADPRIAITDITHDIPPHDIEAAAFLLRAVHRDFPAGTVHVVVVDPGVGSSRKPIVARAHDQLFVGPDNGVLSFVLASDEFSEVHEIRVPAARNELSTTFHGRDIFAPAAAMLAKGAQPQEIGPLVPQPVHLSGLRNDRGPDGMIHGRVIHIDRFGNCITSLKTADLPTGRPFLAQVGAAMISELRPFYESSEDPGPFFTPGSAGFLEISMLRSSAAKTLGIARGDAVAMRLA